MRSISSSLRVHRNQVVALMPSYSPSLGNGTTVYLRSGLQVDLPCTTATALRSYLSLWGLSPSSVRALYGDTTTDRIKPLAIAPGQTLIPLRAREVIGSRDGAYGYLELESLQATLEQPQPGWLSLQVGMHTLLFHCSELQLAAMTARARRAAERLLRATDLASAA